MTHSTAIDYCNAYASLHGVHPTCYQQGKRFHVVNHRGDAFDYSARELAALTIGLRRMASNI